MAGLVRVVTRSRRAAEMPQWTSEFVELAQTVAEGQLLKEVSSRLRFAWRRGFGMLDLAVFFMALACGYRSGGIRGFRTEVRGCAARLAAIAQRERLMTSASVSRTLCAADRIADLDAQAAWLLSEGARVQTLARSAVVQTRDTFGQDLMVLDFDPTVTALRQRALPEGEDLPPPQRRAARLCAPGYAGRHRGETQVSIAVLSHTGAGLFLQATTHAGNTPFAQALGTASDAAAAFAGRCKFDKSRTLIRFDGAGGHTGAMTEVSARGLHFLTRLANLTLLADPDIVTHLADASWSPVADSCSGPRREATELGHYSIRLDGSDQVVAPRLVVSRFASIDGVKRGAGVVKDGWQYEVFATTLAASAWPAAQLVTLYHGRCGQENQFGQAIRDIRLGEVFCYDLAGLRLATILMMWINNLRLARAAAYVGDLGQPPKQQERPEQEPHATSAEPESEPEPDTGVQSREASRAELAPQSQDGLSQTEPVWAPQSESAPGPQSDARPVTSTSVEQANVDRGSALPASTRCPIGLLARLHNIRQIHANGYYAIYRMPPGVCGRCAHVAGCTKTNNPAYAREFSIPLAKEMLANREELLAKARAKEPPNQGTQEQQVVAQASSKPKPTAKDTALPLLRWTPPKNEQPGRLEPTNSALIPAELVRQWRKHHQAFAIEVRIERAKPVPTEPWLASSASRRQCRRHTWHERQQWAALRGTATVIRLQRVDDSRSEFGRIKTCHD